MVATPETRRRYLEIDVLRGFAALTVVLSHYMPYWNRYLGDIPVTVPNEFGYYAVKLFFIISGFVIFSTLERCTRLMDFCVLRFSRLYPVYWASIAFVALAQLVLFGNRIWLGGLLSNATMLQQFIGYPHIDIVFWSLTVELAFYLNVAWLFALNLHRKVHKIVLAWLLLTTLWVAATQQPGDVIATGVAAPATARHYLAMLFVFDYSPYFSAGMLVYHANRHGWSWNTYLLLALAAGVAILLGGWEAVIVLVILVMLVLLALSGFLRFLARPITIWLGTISYALYLVHRNIGYRSLDWLHEHGIGPAIGITITTLGALLLATVLTYGIERPSSSLIRSWHTRSRLSPAETVRKSD